MLSNNISSASKRQRDGSPPPRTAKRSRLPRAADDKKTRVVDDSEFSLKRIRELSGIPIADMIKKIQTTRYERGEASVFVRDLECLRLVHVGDTVEFKRARVNGFNEDCAVISWSWKRSPKHENEKSGSYLIEDAVTRGMMRTSTVRDIVWRRAAAYMRYRRIKYLWIDSECIKQDPVEERQKAMSEMDWLYNQGRHPFGMLTRPITKERELYLLAEILQGKLLRRYDHSDGSYEICLKKGMTAKAWEAVQLLDEITSDSWWTRAWIYQENYHGANRMFLLMPDKTKLEGSKAKYAALFGDLKGELVINSIDFSKASTLLCSAFKSPRRTEDQKNAVERILSRAARYSSLLEEESSMSPTIVTDVLKRCVSEHPDRIDIISNCCSYNVRLARRGLEREGCSVSLAILVLLLLNGEIFHYDPCENTASSSRLTVSEFIQEFAFNRFSPPYLNYGLTFNKGCRFGDVHLDDSGVHTRGHLWRLCKTGITLSRQHSKGRNGVKKTLWDLQKHIDESFDQEQFSSRLEEFLKASSQTAANKYMWKMAEAVAHALHDGQMVRLGYLENSTINLEFSPPTAIFICPDEIMEANKDNVFVFTSFRAKKDGPVLMSDVDKHVSLQVGVKLTEKPPRLYARRWMHGLWFCKDSESRNDVVFPLPRVLSEL